MAEVKTIKRRGFLKALPLAGVAAATPVVTAAAPQCDQPDDIRSLGRRLVKLMSDMHGGERFSLSIDHEHGFVLINRIHYDEKGICSTYTPEPKVGERA